MMVLGLSCEVVMVARPAKLKKQALHCYLIQHKLKVTEKSTIKSNTKRHVTLQKSDTQEIVALPWLCLLCYIYARLSQHDAARPFHSGWFSFLGLLSFPQGTSFSLVDGQHEELQTLFYMHLLYCSYPFHSGKGVQTAKHVSPCCNLQEYSFPWKPNLLYSYFITKWISIPYDQLMGEKDRFLICHLCFFYAIHDWPDVLYIISPENKHGQCWLIQMISKSMQSYDTRHLTLNSRTI